MFATMGLTVDKVWPGVSRLRDFKQTFPRWRNTDFAQVRAHAGPRTKCTHFRFRPMALAELLQLEIVLANLVQCRFNADATDLLRQCLKYNSSERPSAKRMLALRYFTEEDLSRSRTATDLP